MNLDNNLKASTPFIAQGSRLLSAVHPTLRYSNNITASPLFTLLLPHCYWQQSHLKTNLAFCPMFTLALMLKVRTLLPIPFILLLFSWSLILCNGMKDIFLKCYKLNSYTPLWALNPERTTPPDNKIYF